MLLVPLMDYHCISVSSQKNYGRSYNVEVITEIIVRLQDKDHLKRDEKEKIEQMVSPNQNHSEMSVQHRCTHIQILSENSLPSTARRLNTIVANQQQSISEEKKAPIDQRITPFVPCMTLQQAFELKIGDKIDYRDEVGRFVFATVSEKQGTNLKIHYDGWSRKWNIWSDSRYFVDGKRYTM